MFRLQHIQIVQRRRPIFGRCQPLRCAKVSSAPRHLLQFFVPLGAMHQEELHAVEVVELASSEQWLRAMRCGHVDRGKILEKQPHTGVMPLIARSKKRRETTSHCAVHRCVVFKQKACAANVALARCNEQRRVAIVIGVVSLCVHTQEQPCTSEVAVVARSQQRGVAFKGALIDGRACCNQQSGALRMPLAACVVKRSATVTVNLIDRWWGKM